MSHTIKANAANLTQDELILLLSAHEKLPFFDPEAIALPDAYNPNPIYNFPISVSMIHQRQTLADRGWVSN